MKATYHLPGLFEFYELYRLFLPLFYEHREYFYDWCEIGSVYGAPADCRWGGGRAGFGEEVPENVNPTTGKVVAKTATTDDEILEASLDEK